MIHLYDPETRVRVGAWVGWGSVDIPFDARGPVGTGVVVPASAGQTRHELLRPGASAALAEIDATDAGVPMAWLGQVDSWGETLGKPQIDVTLSSPEGWLADIGIHDWPSVAMSAGGWLTEVISAHGATHHLVLGTIEDGAVIDVEGGGLSLWDALGYVEENSDLETRVTAIRGAARLRVSAQHPFSSPRAVGVALQPGVNCADVQLGGKLPTNAKEVIGVAYALLKGAGPQSLGMSIPAGPIVGRKAALGIQASVAVAAQLAGGPVLLTPDTPSLQTLEAQLAREVRLRVAPVVGGTAIITDPGIYRHIAPGTLLGARFDDALGYWARSTLRLRTVTWTVEEGPPPRVTKCAVSFDLWGME